MYSNKYDLFNSKAKCYIEGKIYTKTISTVRYSSLKDFIKAIDTLISFSEGTQRPTETFIF